MHSDENSHVCVMRNSRCTFQIFYRASLISANIIDLIKSVFDQKRIIFSIQPVILTLPDWGPSSDWTHWRLFRCSRVSRPPPRRLRKGRKQRQLLFGTHTTSSSSSTVADVKRHRRLTDVAKKGQLCSTCWSPWRPQNALDISITPKYVNRKTLFLKLFHHKFHERH